MVGDHEGLPSVKIEFSGKPLEGVKNRMRERQSHFCGGRRLWQGFGLEEDKNL